MSVTFVVDVRRNVENVRRKHGFVGKKNVSLCEYGLFLVK